MRTYSYGMKTALICAFVFTIMPALIAADSNGPRAPERISLSDAIALALKNNQDYRLAVLKARQTRERVKGAWGQLLPVLESEASMARQYAENGFMSLSDGQYELRFLQLKFGINPGLFYNSLKATQEAHKIAQEELRRVRANVEYSVIRGYFGVLLAGEIVKLRRESMEVLKSNLKDVQTLYRTGSVPRFDLLQAQVQLKNLEPQLLEAENAWETAIDSFNFTLGNEGIIHTADDSVLGVESYRTPLGEAPRKIEKLALIALKNRPEIIQLEHKRELSVRAKNAASSSYIWPTLTLGGYYGLTKYLPNEIASPVAGFDFSKISGTSDWQNTWQFRVAATYRWSSLVPADPARAVEREEALKIQEADEEIARIKRLIGISIRTSYSRLLTSSATIRSQRENVVTAEEGLRIAREAYRAGAIKNFELLAAELSLTTAKTGYINAIHGYYTSLAELKREMGVDDERVIMEEAE